MTLKNYLIIMLLAAAICWLGFVAVISIVNPFTTNWLGFTLFYASLFMAATGTSAILGFLVRFAVLRQTLAFRAVAEAFRQSFLFAFLVAAILFLLSRGIFNWLNLSLLIAFLALLEFAIMVYGRARSARRQAE